MKGTFQEIVLKAVRCHLRNTAILSSQQLRLPEMESHREALSTSNIESAMVPGALAFLHKPLAAACPLEWGVNIFSCVSSGGPTGSGESSKFMIKPMTLVKHSKSQNKT